MTVAVVTEKGQITIPKPVREALGVKAGDRVRFLEVAKGVFQVVAAMRDVRMLKGLIAKPARPVSIERMKRVVTRVAGS